MGIITASVGSHERASIAQNVRPTRFDVDWRMRPFILLHGKLHMRPCIVRHATLHMRLSNARDCVRFLSTTPLFISVPRSNLSTFVNQDKLKRLPIPSLTETLSKYLNSLRPIVSSEAHLKSTRIAGDFLSKGVGEKLQNKLIAYGKTQKVCASVWSCLAIPCSYHSFYG